MNFYGWLIAAVVAAEYFLGVLSSVLNMRTLGQLLPAEFVGVYGDDAYVKAQSYLGTRERFGIITSTFDTLLLLGFWFCGGFGFLDQAVRGWNLGPILTGVAALGIILLLRSVVSLPFGWYSTFVIEERFGFNRTTARIFILDILKGAVLAAVIGGPLAAAVLALFVYAGPQAWLWCWLTSILFILAVQFVAPAWIMPLFNKFTPMQDGELRSAITSYADSVHFRLRDISVMDGSKRSSKSNAFFTGFGRNKRIALFDTLIAKQTTGELVCVLAHEIGHYRKKHIVKGMLASAAHLGLMFFLFSLFLGHRELTDTFFFAEPSVYAGLIAFGLLATPLEVILSLVFQALSRKHEFEADRFAAETTGTPEAMISALKKLSADNLSHLTPHPLTVALTYSHPPVLQRIRALELLKK
jgi:STE24 endopeptidase